MNLLQSLKFISVAQLKRDVLAPYQNHCILKNGFVVASNGILSAGCKIEEDLECCPQTLALISALSNCGEKLTITQLNGNLSIKSGRFSAVVPCFSEDLPEPKSDAKIAIISDVLKSALAKVSHIAVDQGKTVLESAVLIQAGTVAATSGFVILEAWHGIDLPKCVVPKTFVSAVCDTDKKLANFGYSQNSITFWFEDESWIKTQLYFEKYPDIAYILNVEVEPKPLTEGFYNAIRQVEDFVETGKDRRDKGVVYLTSKGVRSRAKEGEGAFYEIEGLPDGFAFKVKQLKQVEDVCKQVAFDNSKLYCFADNVRGIVQGVKV